MAKNIRTVNTLPVACFAPALTDEKLAAYTALADRAEGPIKDALQTCLKAVKQWWELPASTRTDGEQLQIFDREDPNQERRARNIPIVPLEEKHQGDLNDAIPWPHEIASMQALFDTIPPEQKELRDAAFHLLWHLIELSNDREPLTRDKVRKQG